MVLAVEGKQRASNGLTCVLTLEEDYCTAASAYSSGWSLQYITVAKLLQLSHCRKTVAFHCRTVAPAQYYRTVALSDITVAFSRYRTVAPSHCRTAPHRHWLLMGLGLLLGRVWMQPWCLGWSGCSPMLRKALFPHRRTVRHGTATGCWCNRVRSIEESA